MILQAILTALQFTVEFLLAIVPNIPSFGEDILDGMEYFTDLVAGVIGLVAYLESPAILVFAFTAMLVLLNFDNVYKLVLWFLHKVRG